MKSIIGPLMYNPMVRFISISFLAWRILLELIAKAPFLIRNETFLGSVPWANFDGLHYISIAERGYMLYEQAFFPLYPLLIRYTAYLFDYNWTLTGLVISHVSFYCSLIILWKLIPYTTAIPKEKIKSVQRWSILFILACPTSFYFVSAYTESIFLLFILTAFYLLIHKKYFWYGIVASIASGIRLVGSFLLIPTGLFMYMYYLWVQYGDPLLFIHVQPGFGANRSGGDLVIVPQVIWRYLNIFVKVPIQNYDWWIAFFEFTSFFLVIGLLWMAWRKKYPVQWIYFSAAEVLLPTLSGTFSSMPRYILVAFPIFIVLANFRENYRNTIFVISLMLLGICTLLFTHGYWVS